MNNIRQILQIAQAALVRDLDRLLDAPVDAEVTELQERQARRSHYLLPSLNSAMNSANPSDLIVTEDLQVLIDTLDAELDAELLLPTASEHLMKESIIELKALIFKRKRAAMPGGWRRSHVRITPFDEPLHHSDDQEQSVIVNGETVGTITKVKCSRGSYRSYIAGLYCSRFVVAEYIVTVWGDDKSDDLQKSFEIPRDTSGDLIGCPARQVHGWAKAWARDLYC
tara:strand:- start:1014 stop:1688 length:675 start_codon:yes stop_codon:yes gene_type:complete